MNALVFWLAISLICFSASSASSQSAIHNPQSAVVLPLGLLTPLPVPDDNPLTREKVALGRRLFFDRRLSPNNTMSCAMCHVPAQGFTVNELRVAVGINGQTTKRNPPTLYNVAYQRLLFHDGREFTLEDQIISPLTNPIEMGNPSIGYVVDKVRRLPGYAEQFRQAFDEEVSVATLGKALASYERTLLSANSPFDRWYFAGDRAAASKQVKAGFKIFTGKGQCFACHIVSKEAALFTDQGFHNTGVAQLQIIPEKTVDVDLGGGLVVQMPRAQVDEILTPPSKDLGRYEITLDPTDLWRYKTPSLRNVALTAPYMHNGALLTLEEVIEYYDRGGTGAEGQDPRISPLHLTSEEKKALLAFLRSLTGDNVDVLAKETSPHTEEEVISGNQSSPLPRQTPGCIHVDR
jgi:cytochrome c peroxidase